MAILRNRIQCNKCKDIIESLHRHDYKVCSCGAAAADGGKDYLKRCGIPSEIVELSEYKEEKE